MRRIVSTSAARSSRAGAVLLGLTLVLIVTPLSAQGGRTLLLDGGQMVTATGSLETNPGVLLQEGTIRAVGGSEVERHRAAGGVVLSLAEGAVISPGMIDLLSAIGAFRQNAENIRAVDPETRLREAVDPTHRDLSLACAAGITSAMVCGSGANLVDGAAVIFRTHRRKGGAPLDVLRSDGPLLLCMGSSVLRRDRKPTSRNGAADELRSAFESARAGKGSPTLQRMIRGEVDALLYGETPRDVQALIDLLVEAGVERAFPVAPGTEAAKCAPMLAGRKAPVVVGPYTFASPRSELEAAARLAEEGLEIAFAGGLPRFSSVSPRLSAMLAVRHGLSPEAARRGLTVTAARVAGVSDRVGAIQSGRDADLVVFSGDPLRLESKVEMVFVRGERCSLSGEVKE